MVLAYSCFTFTFHLTMTVQYYGQSTITTTCTCLYPNGMVPNADALPEYANRSAPKF